MKRRAAGVAAAVAVAAATLVLAGCAPAAPKPQLYTMLTDVDSTSIVPVTTGRGDETLRTVTIPAGAHIDISASCVGHGTVTVQVPGADPLIVSCMTENGSQLGSSDYLNTDAGRGPVTVKTTSASTIWNLSVTRPD